MDRKVGCGQLYPAHVTRNKNINKLFLQQKRQYPLSSVQVKIRELGSPAIIGMVAAERRDDAYNL